jgi:hypothetical protein
MFLYIIFNFSDNIATYVDQETEEVSVDDYFVHLL